jgi:hypothetical protein
MRYIAALKEAEKLGRRHGAGAADWYWDRTEPHRQDFLVVLQGIRDGDPAILDTFNTSNVLSGEMADSMTPQRLYEEIGLSETNLRNWEGSFELDEICSMYEREFSSGYEEAVADSCIEGLRRAVIFHIEVEIADQDPFKLLSELVDLLNSKNCDPNNDQVLDADTGEPIRDDVRQLS